MAFSDYQTRVDAIGNVADTVVDEDDRDSCIAEAVREYSKARPRELVGTIQAVGGNTYQYDLTTMDSTWNEDQFTVKQVVYPYNLIQERILDDNLWKVYKRADGHQWLRFAVDQQVESFPWDIIETENPTSGYTIGVYYFAPHVVTGGQGNPTTESDTLQAEKPSDFDAVCHLAASLVLRAAANKYAALQNSTVQGDTVEYQNKSSQYAARAKDERKLYDDHMAQQPNGAGARIDWDTSRLGGGDRLTHKRRWT